MKYLATIHYAEGSHSMMFQRMADAETWIDQNNNNLENTAYIDEYDDNWQKVGSFMYTEARKC